MYLRWRLRNHLLLLIPVSRLPHCFTMFATIVCSYNISVNPPCNHIGTIETYYVKI